MQWWFWKSRGNFTSNVLVALKHIWCYAMSNNQMYFCPVNCNKLENEVRAHLEEWCRDEILVMGFNVREEVALNKSSCVRVPKGSTIWDHLHTSTWSYQYKYNSEQKRGSQWFMVIGVSPLQAQAFGTLYKVVLLLPQRRRKILWWMAFLGRGNCTSFDSCLFDQDHQNNPFLEIGKTPPIDFTY